MEIGSAFVTGANRGLGLELVRQLVNLPKPPKYVFATHRNLNTAQALKQIADSSKQCQVVLIEMDIQNKKDIATARKIVDEKVEDEGLNLLINNAGVLMAQRFADITDENMLLHFKINTFGAIAVLKEMFPLLQRASARHSGSGMSVSKAMVLNMASMDGSGTTVSSLGDSAPDWFRAALGYRASKAALHMAMSIIAEDIKKDAILLVNMYPGWVKTDMGTQDGVVEASECVSGILKTCPLLNETHHGSFINRHGRPSI